MFNVSLKSNPYFATFVGVFAGTILTQLQAAYDSGHLDLTGKGLVHTLIGAAIGAGLSVYHLYLPKPQTQNPPQEQPK